MTIHQVRAAIDADPALSALSVGDATDYDAIAKALTATHTKTVSTLGGIGYVMRVLGPVDGAAVLDALDALRATSSPVRWGWVLLERGDLDFGDPGTQAMVDMLVQVGALTRAQALALQAPTQVPDVVTIHDVAEAMSL